MPKINVTQNNLTKSETSVAFDSWAQEQVDQGLVDMKFAVSTGGLNNPSARVAINEFLQAEKKFAAGIIMPHHSDS